MGERGEGRTMIKGSHTKGSNAENEDDAPNSTKVGSSSGIKCLGAGNAIRVPGVNRP